MLTPRGRRQVTEGFLAHMQVWIHGKIGFQNCDLFVSDRKKGKAFAE
jgi:hypothetical protein